jgi:hypothetical protein
LPASISHAPWKKAMRLAFWLASSGHSIVPRISWVTPDGQEFLLRSTAASQTTSINVVLNWPAAMKEGRQ